MKQVREPRVTGADSERKWIINRNCIFGSAGSRDAGKATEREKKNFFYLINRRFNRRSSAGNHPSNQSRKNFPSFRNRTRRAGCPVYQSLTATPTGRLSARQIKGMKKKQRRIPGYMSFEFANTIKYGPSFSFPVKYSRERQILENRVGEA